MKRYVVITGDIVDFTSLEKAEELIGDTDDHIQRWVKRPKDVYYCTITQRLTHGT